VPSQAFTAHDPLIQPQADMATYVCQDGRSSHTRLWADSPAD